MIMIPAVIMAIESDDDRAYMTDIYLKHHALMLKTAWTFTRVKAEVEDIVSDSCVSMIDNLQKLRTMEDHETRSYIVNIVRNTAINHWRKKQRENARFQHIDNEVMEQMPEEETTEGKIAFDAEIETVRQAIHHLPEKEREILHLKYFEGQSDKEIAEIVGLAESSVRKYIERARKRLKVTIYEGAEQ